MRRTWSWTRGTCESGRRSPRANTGTSSVHTPVSLKEAIPWRCRRLLIGTGMHGRLPVMDEVLAEAQRRGAEIVVCPTAQAIQHLQENPEATNAILHVTC